MTEITKNNHIHKYHRVKLGKHVVYKCSLPNCPHHIRKELVEGRMSVCWRCESAFIITKAQMKLKRPHCVECIKKKKQEKKVVVNKDRLAELLEGRNKTE